MKNVIYFLVPVQQQVLVVSLELHAINIQIQLFVKMLQLMLMEQEDVDGIQHKINAEQELVQILMELKMMYVMHS
jgi:hypothetical protein